MNLPSIFNESSLNNQWIFPQLRATIKGYIFEKQALWGYQIWYREGTTWWLLGDHLVTTWWLLDDHLVTTCWLLGDHLVTKWWLLGDYLVTTWPPLGNYLVTTWWPLGDYLVTTWWLLGDYLATTCQLIGDHCGASPAVHHLQCITCKVYVRGGKALKERENCFIFTLDFIHIFVYERGGKPLKERENCFIFTSNLINIWGQIFYWGKPYIEGYMFKIWWYIEYSQYPS